MSTQPPVRFENYPPDDSASPIGSAEQRTPVVRPYVPETIPAPPTNGGSSRRTVIGLVIGIPIAGILFSSMAASGNPGGVIFDSEGTYDDTDDIDSDTTEDPGTGDAGSSEDMIAVDGYSATAPEGWTVNDDGSGVVEATKGANRLTAVSIDTATSSLAVEEIAHLSEGHHAGFKGTLGDPVDRSSADLQHATLDGTGRYKGKAARLMVELWIDEDGSGLLVVRVLTAKVASTISAEAQGMVDELCGGF